MPTINIKAHLYPSPVRPDRPRAAYEYQFPSPSSPKHSNALIFLPGLGDAPFEVPYVQTLARHLAATNSSYSVFEINLSSAGSAFGYSSLADDVRDVAALVRYLKDKEGRERVVVMGHSTGCQDCLEYASRTGGDVMEVDGYVLQGPVSDREAIGLGVGEGELKGGLEVAEGLVKSGKGGEVLSRGLLPEEWRGSPVTAYRWWSLAGVGGDDDYFSSDLSDEKLASIWNAVQKPVLILPSGADEFVPAAVDVPGMVEKWKGFCRPGMASDLSGLIPGANHRADDAQAQEWLADRVARFLEGLEK
ncbi:hypothetical protein B0T16DRAFT_458422 [Cercophora newfieldiana]|uniref:Peptidase A2 domain-containing protein n=1 Tax=Cercophora newfieldiana TaxID=92897 RepID=A0AA39Y6A5_9PEZI|nr:hypothetical protein B0T16DRAFT_458422 [Cercophora newfieldiana]